MVAYDAVGDVFGVVVVEVGVGHAQRCEDVVVCELTECLA